MVKICCDSTDDLLNEYTGRNIYEERGITVIPLYIRIGEEEFLDGKDIGMLEMFRHCAETKKMPKTAAPDVSYFIKAFKELAADGSEVVFIAISSEFSSSYNNACLAAKEVGIVYVVDSRNLSTGVGFTVLEACDLAESGMNGADIKKQLIEDIIPNADTSFVLDKLDYMVKGGRCSAVTALGANLLQLHPLVQVEDGKMKVTKKYRGSWERCLRNYVKDKLDGNKNIRMKRIFITYTATPPEIVDEVEKLVREYADFDEIIRTTAGCCVASHCGPQTLGVLFIRK